jgi:hypothetical protein
MGSTIPIVLEQETVVFMRDRVRIEHTGPIVLDLARRDQDRLS